MANSFFVSICKDLQESLEKGSKEQVMNECIRNKMISIYEKNNEEFDSLLQKLEYGVNYNEAAQVKKCVTGLLRLLNTNSKSLMETLKKVI